MWTDAIRAGLTTAGVICVFLMLAVCAALQLAPAIREQWAKLRKVKPIEKAAGLVVFSVFFVYGATKWVEDAGADDGIMLAGIAVDYDETNDVSFVDVYFMGVNVTPGTPVSVRNDQKENWREVEKFGAYVTTDLPTNVLSFAVNGDITTNRYWWVGTETPAVIIEIDGIEITHFAASSQNVEIAWTCDDPRAVEYVIERRHKGEQDWQTVAVTSEKYFLYFGFTVGETWEWRVSSTYAATEDDAETDAYTETEGD